MKRLLIGALLAGGLVSHANAQTVHAGTYDVKGTNLDGSRYEGTATITLSSDTTCTIEWTTGDSTSEGVCMLNDNAFAAAYVLEDEIGLVVYEVKDRGVLDGVWTITGRDGSGTEVLKLRR
jgi:hypothetical protein